MRKLFLFGVMVALVFAFGPLAMAKSHPQYTCAPDDLQVEPFGPVADTADTIEQRDICFDWDWECSGTPTKYSIDVELLVSGDDWDDPDAEIQKLSFGTGDRTDGQPLDATFLCVPIEEFVYWDVDHYAPFRGFARAKVKALGKGGRYSTQNNAWSDWSADFLVGIIVDDFAPDLVPGP